MPLTHKLAAAFLVGAPLGAFAGSHPPPARRQDPAPSLPAPPAQIPEEVSADEIPMLAIGCAASPDCSISRALVLCSGRLPKTDMALDRGSTWLERRQSADGSWSNPYDAPEGDARIERTALALLALRAAHGPGETSGRAVLYLKSVQRDDGAFADSDRAHALATLALIRASPSEGFSPVLRKPVARACDWLERRQRPSGAWTLESPDGAVADAVVTAWVLRALHAAGTVGMDSSKACIRSAEAWLVAQSGPWSGRATCCASAGPAHSSWRHDRDGALVPRRAGVDRATAASLGSCVLLVDRAVIRRWREHPRFDPLRRQADHVRTTRPALDASATAEDLEYAYFASCALDLWGGGAEEEWRNLVLLPLRARVLADEDGAKASFAGFDDVERAALAMLALGQLLPATHSRGAR